jgi:hypothetical protein
MVFHADTLHLKEWNERTISILPISRKGKVEIMPALERRMDKLKEVIKQIKTIKVQKRTIPLSP